MLRFVSAFLLSSVLLTRAETIEQSGLHIRGALHEAQTQVPVGVAIPTKTITQTPTALRMSTTKWPLTGSQAGTKWATSATHIQYAIRSGQVKMEGVNLGGWLVLERWMTENSPVSMAVDKDTGDLGEFVIMSKLGHATGDALFEQHRSQWITEADIAEIAQFGLNTVRVPVGYWIMGYDNNDPSNKQQWKVFAPGALKYLDLLINNWALKYNVAVMLSFHAHKGSQNGHDHSAAPSAGEINWHLYPENVENSVQVALFLANRYKDSPAFLGMNLMNEPEVGDQYFSVVTDYYLRAYQLIRNTGNDCVLVTSPLLLQQNGGVMRDFMRWPSFTNVWHEWHPYFIWKYEQSSADEIMNAVRAKQVDIRNWPGNYLLMGEWCGASPNADINTKTPQFLQAQVQAFREAQGFTYWSWKHSDDMVAGRQTGWSMRQQLRNGNLQLKSPTLPAAITLKAVANGKFVSADNAGTSPLIANRATAQGWEIFDVVSNADKTISLRARANGKFVTAENAGTSALIANRDGIQLWEKFTVLKHPDGSYSFRSQVSGQFVSANSAGTNPLIANRNFAQGWEQFWVAAA